MKSPKIPESEVTDERLFLNRREMLRLGTTATLATLLAGCPAADEADARPAKDERTPELTGVTPASARYRVDEATNSWEDATSYNNFYEFGTGKKDPARNAHTLRPSPWSVVVEAPPLVQQHARHQPRQISQHIHRIPLAPIGQETLEHLGPHGQQQAHH